ncbi:hypothetical protein Lfee_2514 [Legionella feeleii]|uniref:Uncharacterized protein n=1 Tax=Legionella feeleii TaxID=453 RepID=A0A0W0TGY6_9GAMM|nr:hypothetical protein Lfee_2514 [Legionella feeleii]SPX62067.1 Uncharacterised protein [Legionella feeleii]
MPKALIAVLWKQLSDIYESRFTREHGESDASGVWYQALNDLSRDDLRHGLYALYRDIRFETWPPNCTQFRHLCLKRTGEGIPTVHEAFREVQAHLLSPKRTRWSHRVVKHALARTGVVFMDKAAVHQSFAVFKSVYEALCQQLAEGVLLAEVPEEALLPVRTRSKPIPNLQSLLRRA